jgi:large subunit ribosomal protein L13
VDAEGQTLGRLASKIAPYLTGKNKPIYAPNIDTGDYVIVINCEKIAVTGNRMDQKFYHRYSGYPGGLRSISLREQLESHPDRVIMSAVKGMLPSNAIGRQMLKKLKVYAGTEHPHAAQKPQVLEL